MTEQYNSMGKRFECNQCGKCCRNKGGHIILTRQDLDNISNYLNLDYETFCQQYDVQDENGKLYFIYCEDECPFIGQDNRCSVQHIKPLFCKIWIPLVEYEDNYLYQCCEGIGTGKEFSDEDIQEIREEINKNFIIVEEKQ